jgi:hypothetical protein
MAKGVQKALHGDQRPYSEPGFPLNNSRSSLLLCLHRPSTVDEATKQRGSSASRKKQITRVENRAPLFTVFFSRKAVRQPRQLSLVAPNTLERHETFCAKENR